MLMTSACSSALTRHHAAPRIIIAAGYFPGYYVTAALVEKIGRRPIQLIGFVMTTIFLFIGGMWFHHLRKRAAPFFIVFTFLQFFFNFGANATTFIIPAEVFPSRVRTSAYGVSAACGKCGAILASLGFVTWADHIGTGAVLLIFSAVSLLGIPFALLIPETKGRDADVIDRDELLVDAVNAADGGIGGSYAATKLEKTPEHA
jgi:MFS transporter, PHS family, inorganic phosphate transporter